MSFFGCKLSNLPANIKIKRKAFNKCTPGLRCRGSLPFDKDGNVKVGDDSVIKYVYHDGPPDDGVWVTLCTAEYKGNTFCWIEE